MRNLLVVNSETASKFASPAGRRWLFGLLYMSEGAPMGFIWWALPSILTAKGVDIATVTALASFLTLPWVFKFLAGPLIDFGVRRGQRLRTWISVCQVCMGLALLPLALIDWSADYSVLVAVLFVHACFAAVQDVSIDTLAIRTIPVEELGKINGWMQTGMLTGRALVAAGAVALAAAGHQALIVLVLVFLVWFPLLILQLARPEEGDSHKAASAGVKELIRGLMTLAVVVGLWIALTAGAGFEFFTVTAGPLLQELGGEPRHTALLFGVVAPVGLALGALAGGYFASIYGIRLATGAGIILVGLSVAAFSIVRAASFELGPFGWLVPLLGIYLAAGFLICASYTLLMHLSRGEYAATKFSVFMSATNGCEAWAAFAGGRLVGPLGYTSTMLVLVAASLLALPALILTRVFKGKNDDEQ